MALPQYLNQNQFNKPIQPKTAISPIDWSGLWNKTKSFLIPNPVAPRPVTPSPLAGIGQGVGTFQLPNINQVAPTPPVPVSPLGSMEFKPQSIPEVKTPVASPVSPALRVSTPNLNAQLNAGKQQLLALQDQLNQQNSQNLPPVASNQPQTQPIPQLPPESQSAVQKAEEALAKASQISPEEYSTQEDLDRLQESARKAYTDIENKAIPLQFIHNQLSSVERRATDLAIPLEQRLARLQAKRTATLESSKYSLSRLDKKAELEKDKLTAGKPTSVQEYEYAKSQGYKGSFSDYQNEDANRKAKATGSDVPLSVTEAQALGVPYGTTRSQAIGLSVSGKPTAEQSKARQFAVSAENANQVLNTLGYDPGIIESGLVPNVFKSSARQQFEQASRAFVNSVLRRESGATITDDEFKNKYKELIPQAGDGEAVKQQKQAARIAAVKSITEAGGNVPSGSPTNDPLGLF